MKKIIIVLTMLLFVTGCDFVDDFSDKFVYTTSYPIEYATNMLYKDHANISSVYPNGATSKYEVTDKKKEEQEGKEESHVKKRREEASVTIIHFGKNAV